MGFHICIVGYLFGIPVLPLCEAHLMIRFFLSSLPCTASRKACQRYCKQSLIITPEVCARRRAASCTSRRSASPRTGIDDTAYIGIETPGSDPPARWPRHKKRGKRGDAGEDAWRDPCNARRILGIRQSPWYTVDDGTCGPGVNAGDSRINQQDRPSAQRPERLAGSADRAYTGYLQTK